jgi:hypothetical protein
MPQRSSTTKVSGSTTPGVLLAANSRRRGGCLYNDSSAILYLLLGDDVGADKFTVKLGPINEFGLGEYYEIPFGYTGVLSGFWDSATGSVRITEVS